jgi:hypothetical protein
MKTNEIKRKKVFYMKTLKQISKSIILLALPILCICLIHNAYKVYLADPNMHSALAYGIEIILLGILTFISSKVASKHIIKIIKKEIRTDEVKLKLQKFFEVDQFPKHFYSVYDENNNFIGYIVNKLE